MLTFNYDSKSTALFIRQDDNKDKDNPKIDVLQQ